ncbi:MAG TPA: hypothetical protein PLO78_08000 [Candidatus Omnitrophota bacterium]|nr:hypothetical protein [Candidatus Omnitrophota bacterium]
MICQHRELTQGRWAKMPFMEQMANIGSEVERALAWRAKQKETYCQKSFERALELIDLSLESNAGFSRRKELARIREFFVDYLFGDNQFQFTDEAWHRYFSGFFYAARRDR